MSHRRIGLVLIGVLLGAASTRTLGGTSKGQYFGHGAAEDRFGVIAPWYEGQNGQCDFRVRIAAETLKRYPWADKPLAVVPAPHFVFNGHWSIGPDGTIRVDPKLPDWHNGDIGQRSASLLMGLTNYYRYTGDPAAIGLVTILADYLLDYCQTPADHPWPRFLISCPTKGKAYQAADPHGFIQLDVSAYVGLGMASTYELTGNPRYLEAVKHWADLLAEHCDRRLGSPPWNRYANPEDVKWDTRQMVGAAVVAQFLDDVIRLGHRGKNDALVTARDAGQRYVRDVLLPEWTRDPTWGRYFWDWENPTMTCSGPRFLGQYVMNHRDAFPQWKTDLRNIMSLLFCRTSVDPSSLSGVYSGAWAFPESSSCCNDSLQYPTMGLAAILAQYGALAGDPWAQEIARRQSILTTYDAHETGVVEDSIDGGFVVTNDWFNLAHPWPFCCTLDMITWQPGTMGANRENHLVRTSSVVQTVTYGKGRVSYTVFDAAAPCEDVLRLAFSPRSVRADGKPLAQREKAGENGYQIEPLPGGDCLVIVRHDGCREVLVEGDDPQQSAEDHQVQYAGAWSAENAPEASGGSLHHASSAGASASFTFEGNQVRLIGRVDPNGGKADVYLDGARQLCGIDFWCPQVRHQQVVYYRNGLAQGKHTLQIVASGSKNPRSQGTQVCVDAAQWSAAQGRSGFGEGSGPGEAQRVIFGYVGRKDYVDSQGHAWRPAMEFIMRKKVLADLVPMSFWTEPQTEKVDGTTDPELYRYGVYGADFTAYFTVNPQPTYYVRIKLCEAQSPKTPGEHATSIALQGNTVAEDLDIAAAAGGVGKALDLVFNDVRPQNGAIALRFWHRQKGTAMVQAIEVGPGKASGK